MRGDQLRRGEDVAWVDGPGKVVRSRLLEDCLWIYRIEANPGMPRGGILPPAPVLAPGRRSGRVPALPYPPPRPLQGIGDNDHLAIGGAVSRSQGEAAGSARDRARIRRRLKGPHGERDRRRGAGIGVRCHFFKILSI